MICSIFGNLETGRMWQVNHKRIRENNEVIPENQLPYNQLRSYQR